MRYFYVTVGDMVVVTQVLYVIISAGCCRVSLHE